MGSNQREYAAGGQARYRNPPVSEPSSRAGAALRSSHPAVIQGRSVHQSYVFDATERRHVLIEGINNAKTGNHITVGPWRGMRLYNLSLEERATCPRSCTQWDTCFGNGSPVAVRFRHNDNLMIRLNTELAELSHQHRRRLGFAVRLHILGDFPTVAYVRDWIWWLNHFPKLHVWGYTARPRTSDIGRLIDEMNLLAPARWRIRFSVAEGAPRAPGQVITTWTKPASLDYDPVSQSMVCPQEIGRVDHCATCGICWNPKLDHKRVVFLGHG